MHCRLCVLGGRKGRFSPLTSALRHYRRNACRSPRLPTPGRCQSVPNATSRIQLQLCDVKSPCASPSYLTDAHAAPNLGQIEKIDDTFDAVGLGGIANCIVNCTPIERRGGPSGALQFNHDGMETSSVEVAPGMVNCRERGQVDAADTLRTWPGADNASLLIAGHQLGAFHGRPSMHGPGTQAAGSK